MRISRPDGVLVIVSKYKQFRVNFDMNTCNCAEKKKIDCKNRRNYI